MTYTDAAALHGMIDPWAQGVDPLNEQLATAIRRAIDRGDMPPGSRLPSERELANQLGVSRTTIVAAYDRLRASGMVRSRHGSGTRVASRDAEAVTGPASHAPGLFQPYLAMDDERTARFATVEDVISLTVGALPAWDGLADLIAQTAREDMPALLKDFGYLPFGLPELRAAIGRHLDSLGLPTRDDEVLVTSGAQQAIHLVSRELAAPGSAVAIEDPTYLGAVDALRAVGARMLPIPLDRDGIRLDVLARTLATGSPAFTYVVPTFQNPTGSSLPEDSRSELARLAELHRTVIVEDLTPTLRTSRIPKPIAAFAAPDRIVTIGSLSKGGWGGLRIGWVRADRRLIMRLASAKAIDDHGSSILPQAVAVRVLANAATHAERAERESSIRREHALAAIRQQLPDWDVAPPLGGLSLWVRLPRGDGESFSRLAAGHGVIVRPGPVASPQGGFRDYLRIAVGEDPERLSEGIRRLAEAWSDYVPGGRSSVQSIAISV